MTTAPSSSSTITSPGKIAQPPQAIGCCQPTNVRPFTDAGAATPAHQTGSREASTPALSRTAPSVTSAVTLRFIIRAVRISPKIPALVTPIASATAIQPAGISSIALRVEIGWPQLSGVARSSRTGTKRSVKAGPTRRSPPGVSGFGPFIQHRRMPFLSSMVVIVAVVTRRRMSKHCSVVVMEIPWPGPSEDPALCGRVGAHELENDRIHQRLERRFNDIRRHPNRRPALARFVAAFDQHAGHRAAAPIEDSDPIVGQFETGDERLVFAEILAQRKVEGVDRPIALSRRDQVLLPDLHLDHRHGDGLPLAFGAEALLHPDIERFDVKIRRHGAEHPARQQLERGIGGL